RHALGCVREVVEPEAKCRKELIDRHPFLRLRVTHGHRRGSLSSKHRHSAECSAYWQYLLDSKSTNGRRSTPSTACDTSREACYATSRYTCQPGSAVRRGLDRRGHGRRATLWLVGRRPGQDLQ